MGEKMYQGSVILTKLVYLNLLWVFFTLLGGGVFGIMPATVALFAVLRQGLMKESDSLKIGASFISYYRKEFMRTNLSGIIIVILAYLLFTNYQITAATPSYLMTALHYFSIVLLCLFVLLLVFYFPVYVHFQLPLRKQLLQPLLLIFFCPFEVCKIVVILIGTYHLFHWIPGLLPLVYMSLPASLIMYTLYRRFLTLPIRDN